MRRWKTEMETVGGTGAEDSCSTSYMTYNLVRARQVINAIRERDGTPKRKIQPIATYLLEDLINQYFEKYASKGAVLEKITIEMKS